MQVAYKKVNSKPARYEGNKHISPKECKRPCILKLEEQNTYEMKGSGGSR